MTPCLPIYEVVGFGWFRAKPKRNLLMRWFRSFGETGLVLLLRSEQFQETETGFAFLSGPQASVCTLQG